MDENGKVTALTPGTATITVTTEDGGFTATCTVTVEEQSYELRSYCLEDASNYNGILNVIHFQYGTKFGSAAASSFYIVPWNSGEHALVKDTDAAHFEAKSSSPGFVTVSVEKISNYYAFLVKAVSDPSDSEVYSDLELKYTDVGGTSITKKVRVSIAPSKAASAFQYDLYTFDGVSIKAAGSTYTHVMSKSDASFVRLFTRYKGITTAGNVPDTEEMATYSWNSSNTSVVAITKKILEGENKAPYPELTFKAPGTSTVKYNYTDYKGNKMSKSIAFTVVADYFVTGDYVSNKASDTGNSSSSPYYGGVGESALKLYIFDKSKNQYSAPALQSVTWSSSKTTVATVSGSGPAATVTFKAAGTATITATDATGAKLNYYVTVYNPITALTGNSTPFYVGCSVSAAEGATVQMQAGTDYTVTPSSGTMSDPKYFTWSSSNTSYATVGSSGLVTIKSLYGSDGREAVISAKPQYGSIGAQQVRAFRCCYWEFVCSYSTSETSGTIKKNDYFRSSSNTFSINPGTVANLILHARSDGKWGEIRFGSGTFTIENSDSSVATVVHKTSSSTNDNYVQVTANKAGTTTAKVKLIDHNTYFVTSFTINVYKPVTAITPKSTKTLKVSYSSNYTTNKNEYQLAKGTDFTITPSDATYQDMTDFEWSSDNSSAISVDSKGLVTFKDYEKTAKISARPKYGSLGTVAVKMFQTIRWQMECIYSDRSSDAGITVAENGKKYDNGDKDEITMFVDQLARFRIKDVTNSTYLKDNAYSVTSSNTSIALVGTGNNSGEYYVYVRAQLVPGTSTISAVYKNDDYWVRKQFKVTVVQNPFKWNTNDFIAPSAEGWGPWGSTNPYYKEHGKSFTMIAWDKVNSALYSSDVSKQIKWTSSNTNVATVSPATGSSTTVTMSNTNAGIACITGTDSYGTKLTCYVTNGYKFDSNDIAIGDGEGVNPGTSSSPMYYKVGSSDKMIIYKKGSGDVTVANAQFISWSSKNTSYITVSPTQGYETTASFKAAGKTEIVATDNWGNTRSNWVQVYTSLSSTSVPFKVATNNKSGNVTYQMNRYADMIFDPSSATVDPSRFTWSSSNTSVATVSETGLVTIPNSTNNGSSTVVTGTLKHGSREKITRTFQLISWGMKAIQANSGTGITVGDSFDNWDQTINIKGAGNLRLRFYDSSNSVDLKGDSYTFTTTASSDDFGCGVSDYSEDGYYFYITTYPSASGKTATITLTYSNNSYYVTKTFKVKGDF